MTPVEKYQQTLIQQSYQADPAQQLAIESLQVLYDDALSQPAPGALKRLLQRLGYITPPITGLYLWGSVGRGKTWLMDLFYECLPFENKYRSHFHRFMQQVHDEMQQYTGLKNPLKQVARSLARQNRIICLDEFHVSDITDAMILYGLIRYLQHYGTTLVLTSNQPPDDLYKNGLQRDRFLPAIELIKDSCRIINVNGQTDHRLRLLQQTNIYYSPVTDEVNRSISQRFEELSPCVPQTDTTITINHREIPVLKLSDDVVWFDFDKLFNSPRGTADYLELAKRFHTVFITDIPLLDDSNDDRAKRFIHLMDEFYDRKVKVLISASKPPESLYSGRRLHKEFERTISRLEEMRSIDYLKQAHRA